MALIAIGADKGAPGVTTTALALAAVWPRPVLLAECDPAGGDLVYRLPAADGGRLDPRRGVLSLAVAARRGMQSNQVWEQTQKLHGGLDVLTGVTNAEQGAGLNLLWGPVGKMLAGIPHADVIADCGRIGVDGPHYDLLAEATLVVLITRPVLGEVIRLRDRVAAVAAAASKRGRRGFVVDVVVVADHKRFKITLGEVAHALTQGNVPARIVGALADETKSAEMLCGEWGGRLDKTLLMRTARDIAQRLAESLPMLSGPGQGQGPGQQGHESWGQGPQPGAPSAQGGRHAGYPPGSPQSYPAAAPSYSPVAQSYEPVAQSHQPVAQSHQRVAQSHQRVAQSHQPPVPSYESRLPSVPAQAAVLQSPPQITPVPNGQVSHEAPSVSLSQAPLPPWPASPPPPGVADQDQASPEPLVAPPSGESSNGQSSNGHRKR
jgi:uncharacterized protein YwbE